MSFYFSFGYRRLAVQFSLNNGRGFESHHEKNFYQWFVGPFYISWNRRPL